MALSAPQSGDMLPPGDVQNKVLLVVPTEYLPSVQTVNGDSPAIKVEVAVLSDHENENGVPTYSGVMWFSAKLHNNLKRQMGETILAAMGQGAAQPGKNAPWQLESMMGNPDWVAFAEAWLAEPVGKAWEATGQQLAREAAANPTATAPVSAPPVQQAAPAPAPRPQAVAQAPAAGGFPTQPVGFAQNAPTATAAPTAPAGDLAAQMAALGPAEREAMMRLLGMQQQ